MPIQVGLRAKTFTTMLTLETRIFYVGADVTFQIVDRFENSVAVSTEKNAVNISVDGVLVASQASYPLAFHRTEPANVGLLPGIMSN